MRPRVPQRFRGDSRGRQVYLSCGESLRPKSESEIYYLKRRKD